MRPSAPYSTPVLTLLVMGNTRILNFGTTIQGQSFWEGGGEVELLFVHKYFVYEFENWKKIILKILIN